MQQKKKHYKRLCIQEYVYSCIFILDCSLWKWTIVLSQINIYFHLSLCFLQSKWKTATSFLLQDLIWVWLLQWDNETTTSRTEVISCCGGCGVWSTSVILLWEAAHCELKQCFLIFPSCRGPTCLLRFQSVVCHALLPNQLLTSRKKTWSDLTETNAIRSAASQWQKHLFGCSLSRAAPGLSCAHIVMPVANPHINRFRWWTTEHTASNAQLWGDFPFF